MQLVFTSKMLEKHLWKSDILSKDADVPISHPLKKPENIWFSGLFRGYKIGTLVRNGLTTLTALIVCKHTLS